MNNSKSRKKPYSIIATAKLILASNCASMILPHLLKAFIALLKSFSSTRPAKMSVGNNLKSTVKRY